MVSGFHSIIYKKKGLTYDGFNLVNPNKNPDADLPDIYVTRSKSWSPTIFSVLSCLGTLPPGEGQQLLKSCCTVIKFPFLSCPGTLPSGEGQQLLKSCCTVMKFPLENFQLHRF